MEAPERIGAPAGTGRSTAWPRAAVPLVRALVQLWTWPLLIGATLVGFAGCHLGSIVLGRERAFAQGIHLWARAVLRLGACKVAVETEPLPAGCVVVANHQGFGDVLVLAAVLPPPVVFAARAGLFRVPLLGAVLRAGGHLRVERGGPSRSRALLRSAAAAAAAGRTVVFFAEGTRSREGQIQPLRAGAFHAAARAGRPLVPVVLAGTRSLWGPGTLRLLPSRVGVDVLPARSAGARASAPPQRAALRDEMAARLWRMAVRSGPRV